MADKWEDRTVEENKSASSPPSDTETFEQKGHGDLEEVFKAEGSNIFGGSSPLQGASSTESDDRKPAARQGMKHAFDDELDRTYFDIEAPPPDSKRARTTQDDDATVAAHMPMPSLHEQPPSRVGNVARLPTQPHEHPGQLHMSFNLPYQAAAATPVAHRPDVHATHDPFSNPSPGYAAYLQDLSHAGGLPQPQSHESPHRGTVTYPSHPHYHQHYHMYPRYSSYTTSHPSHPNPNPDAHVVGSPEDARTRTVGTASGENPREYRRGPTPEELDNAKTARARSALNTWYQRLDDPSRPVSFCFCVRQCSTKV